MALPSQRESLNRLVGFAAAADRRRKAQAKTPSMTGVNQTSVEIKSFEEAMNVAMTAILGGPSAVGKDFSSIQSIAKNKDSLFGVINDKRNLVKNLDSVLTEVAKDTKTIIESITGEFGVEMQTQYLSEIAESVSELVEKLNKKKSKGGDKVQLIQLAAGDANVGNLLKSLQDFDEKSLEKVEKIVTELNKLNSIDLSKFKENIQVLDDDVIKNLADKFDGIKDLYENHVAGAAEAAAKGEKDLKTINDTNEKTSEVIVEGKKPDKKQLQDAKTTYEGMASTILASAFVMIIGALIIKAMPEFPELALKFAGTLALFTAAVMTPLVLADIIMSKYGGKGAQSFNVIGDIIATAAFVMIIGGLFMKIPEMPEKSLEFTKQLAIFLVLTIGAIGLVSRLAKPELLEQVKGLGNLIVLSAIVMVIGALFMKIDWLPKNALKFGAVLGLFIAVVLGPLMLLSHIGANRKMQNDLKGVSNLIVTCTVVMMIGALFMLLDNGKFVKNALIFGAVLSLFIALVLVPFLILKPLIGMAEHTLKDVTRLIVTCTIIMMVGALFVMLGGGKFIRASITFAVLLTFFLTMCILPILFLKPFIQQGLRMLRDVTLFVLVATIVMLIGAFLILNHPEYIWASLKFGLILAAFIAATLLPVIILGKFINEGLKTIGKIALFIAVSAAVMLIGALFMKKGYGWAAVEFTVVFGIFILAMAGTMFILSMIPNLKQAVINASLLGLAIATLSVAFTILAISMNLMTVGDFVKFLLCTTIIAAAFAILGIPEVAAFVGIGAVVAAVMGVALTALSVAFIILHLAMTVTDPFEDFTKLSLTLIVTGLVFAALGALSPLIAFGSVAAGMMGVSLMILSGAFVILHYAMTVSEPWEDFTKLSLTLIVAGAVFGLLGALGPLIIWGSVAAGAMGLSLMILGAAFLLLHKCVGTKDVHPWEDFTKLSLTLVVAGIVFGILGPMYPLILLGSVSAAAMSGALMLIAIAFDMIGAMCENHPNIADNIKTIHKAITLSGLVFTLLGVLSPVILLGSAAATLMGGAFTLISIAFGYVSSICQTYPTLLDDIKTIDKAIALSGLLFFALGLLSIPIALGSVAATMMTTTLLLLSGAFLVVDAIVSDYDIIENTQTMIKTVGLMGLLFAGLGLLFPAIIFGGIVMALMTPLLLGLSYCITKMAVATMLANAMPDPSKATGRISSFFNLIWAFPSGLKVLKMYWRLGTVGPLAKELSRVIAMMGASVKGIADLKIATEWDEKGNPVAFRHLNEQDFTNAGTNVGKIISTLGDALIGIYDKRPELFMDGPDSVIFTVLRASMYMGMVISFIARGLQSYANLLIPDEWNNEGKPIHFVPFTTEDFENAANGIKTILFTLGGAILDFIRENPDLVAYMEETRGGFMGLSKNPSKFASVCIAGKTIGDLIGGIAQGLTAFANMMYPVHWNKDGHPDRFEPMTDAMIIQAKVRIVDILTDMTDAISAAYDKINNSGGFFDRIFGNPKKVKEKIECFTSVGSIISGIAEGLSKYAALMIPDQWNKEGKPIHFVKMSDTDIMMAKLNIINILKSMAVAVSDAYYSIPGSASEIKERIEAFVPLGNLIGSFATGLQSYAQLLIPTKWDKEGRPVAFEKMSNADIWMAGINIGTVLITMAKAVWNAYNMFQQGKDAEGKSIGMKPDDIKKVIEGFKPIGNIVANTATGLQSYATLMIPDKWNNEGKPIHFKKLPDDFFIKAAFNIGLIMLATAHALIAVYDNNQDLFGDKNPKFKKVVELGKGLSEIVNGVATGLQAYANLLIPTKWNNEGKPIDFRQMKDTDIIEAKNNIKLLIVSMAEAMFNASENETIKYFIGSGRKTMDNMKDLTENILELVGDVCSIVSNLSELKVPTGFDKDGKATGYKQLSDTAITNMKNNMGLLLLSIPQVIVETCIDGEHADWFKTKIPAEERNIVKTLNSAGNIMDTIVTNVEKLLEPDAVKAIKDVMGYKKQFKGTAADVWMTSELTPGLFIDYAAVVMGFLDINRQFAYTTFNYVNTSKAVSTVSMETTLLSAMARNLTILLGWSKTMVLAHTLEIPGLKYRNNHVLPVFRAMVDLYAGFMLLNREFTGEGLVGIVKNFLDRKEAESITKLVNTIGVLSTTIAVTANKITDKVNSITDVTMNKAKLAETLANMKGVIALLSDIFGNDLSSTESKTIFSFFGFSKTIEYEKRINTKKILENVNWLNDVIKAFTLTTKIAEKINENAFDNFIFALTDVQNHASSLKEEDIKKFEHEVKITKEFVKAIDTVKVTKVMALTKLLEQMDKLGQHMGDLDKFTKVLAEQLAGTLDQLTKQIRDAQRTIKDADRIQRQRHELIDNSISKVQKMMESTLQVNVTTTTSGSDTSTEVTEEQR